MPKVPKMPKMPKVLNMVKRRLWMGDQRSFIPGGMAKIPASKHFSVFPVP
jgi:hypothetical protein